MLHRVNNNAYKLELPGECNVSTTFNVADLNPFRDEEDLDLRTNPSQVEGTDVCTDLRPNDEQRVYRNIEGLEVANLAFATWVGH